MVSILVVNVVKIVRVVQTAQVGRCNNNNQIRKDKNDKTIVQYLQTTAGRVLLNYTIKTTLNLKL